MGIQRSELADWISARTMRCRCRSIQPSSLSRIRSQLRSKQIADELWERLRLTEERQNTNQQVVTAVKKERRTYRVGAIAIVLVLITVGLVSFSFYHRSHAENVRVYAAAFIHQYLAL
jgi:hypothetical protein